MCHHRWRLEVIPTRSQQICQLPTLNTLTTTTTNWTWHRLRKSDGNTSTVAPHYLRRPVFLHLSSPLFSLSQLASAHSAFAGDLVYQQIFADRWRFCGRFVVGTNLRLDGDMFVRLTFHLSKLSCSDGGGREDLCGLPPHPPRFVSSLPTPQHFQLCCKWPSR